MSARPQQKQASPMVSVAVTIVGVQIGAVVQLLGLPGAAVIWAAMLIGSQMHPPAALTGRKDPKTQQLQPGTPAEEQAQRRYRFWSQIPLLPSRAWLPGRPIRASFVAAVLAGLTAWGLPAAWPQASWVNAAAAFVIVQALTSARRDFPATGDPHPAMRLDSLVPALRARPKMMTARALVGGGLAASACVVVERGLSQPMVADAWAQSLSTIVTRFPGIPVPMLEPASQLMISAIGIIALGAMLGLRGPWTAYALASWRLLTEARHEWAERWERIGQKEPPQLLERTTVGEVAVVDVFDTGGLPASKLTNSSTEAALVSAIGQGVKVASLSQPDIDPTTGQPRPGTLNPRQFRVVTWVAALPSPADGGADEDAIRLALESAMAWTADQTAWPRPILDQAACISSAPEPSADPANQEPDPLAVTESASPTSSRRPQADDRGRWWSRITGAVRRQVTPQLGPHDDEPEPLQPDGPDPSPLSGSPTGDGPRPADGSDDQLLSGLMGNPVAAPIPSISSTHLTAPSAGRTDPPGQPASTTPPDRSPRPRLIGDDGVLDVGGWLLAFLPRRAAATSARTQRAVGGRLDRLATWVESWTQRGASVRETAPSPSRVWATTWLRPDGRPPAVTMKLLFPGPMSGHLNCEVVMDHRAGAGTGLLLCGDLAGCGDRLDASRLPIPPNESNVPLPEALAHLAREQFWDAAWSAAMKNDPDLPTCYHSQHHTHRFARGEVESMTFLVRKGRLPKEFFGLEAKLATAMDAMELVSITGFLAANASRRGERHPQAITVHTSRTPPPAIENLAPEPGSDAPRIILAWYLHRAFEAARLERPEVVSVRALSARSAPGHVWELEVRLYGSTTVELVRQAATKLQTSIGVSWMRIVASEQDSDCRILLGADPAQTRLARRSDQATVATYEWQQAFWSSKLIGDAGALPEVIDTQTMEHNDKVSTVDIRIPPGISMDRIKGARGKLQTAARYGYIEIRPGVHGADSARLVVARDNPMPFPALYDWDFDPGPGGIPFGVGVDGQPIVLNPRDHTHFGLFGLSNSGKSAAAAVLLTGALMAGHDAVICDTQKHGADFRFAADHCLKIATDLLEVQATMEAVYAEVKRRARQNADHGVVNALDLPAEVRPRQLYLFLDEFLGLIQNGKPPSKTAETDPEMESERLMRWAEFTARKRIAYLTGRIAAEARSGGIHLVLMTQKLTVNMLDDAADLKTNLNRVLLGNSNSGERASALRRWESTPDLGSFIPYGRGIWESATSEPSVVQFWFAPPNELGARLRDQVPPVDDARRLDVAAFRPSTNQGASFQVVGGNVAPAGNQQSPLAPTLGALDLSDDAPIEIELDPLELDDLPDVGDERPGEETSATPDSQAEDIDHEPASDAFAVEEVLFDDADTHAPDPAPPDGLVTSPKQPADEEWEEVDIADFAPTAPRRTRKATTAPGHEPPVDMSNPLGALTRNRGRREPVIPPRRDRTAAGDWDDTDDDW